MRLYLASTSPSRLRLLRDAGVEPVVVPPEVDEDEIEAAAGAMAPAALVQHLATAKAEAVAARLAPADGFVLGCDSLFEIDGAAQGKPHDPEVAAARWHGMRGRTGVLHTGHCLIAPGGTRAEAVTSTAVTFADVSDEEIAWYVGTGEPLKVAGAFKTEGLAAAFITRVDGDPRSVAGLSIATLRELALALGAPWTALVRP